MQNVGFKKLVSSGNQVLYPADTPVFSVPTTSFGAPAKPLVKAGQWVWYNPETGVSVGSGALATMNQVAIGVGVGPHVGGPADFLQTCIYDAIDINGIDYSTVSPPRCAGAPSGRLLFDCLNCDSDIAVKIRYRNNNTEQFKDLNQWDHITLYASKACPSCDACTTADYSLAYACALEESLKVKPADFSKPTGSYGIPVSPTVPLSVTRISTGMTKYAFCLNPVVTTCSNCIKLDAIIGVRWVGIGEEDADVDTFFTNTVDPSDSTKTFKDQIDLIIDQINADMAAKSLLGKAYRTHGAANNCCPEKISIISCSAVKLLGGTEEEAVAIDPCATGNMLAAVPIEAPCIGCDDEAPATTKTYAAGIEIAFDLEDYMCGCDIDLPGKAFHSIEYDVEVIGMDRAHYAWVEDQAMVMPQNSGYQLMHMELSEEIGGQGRNFDYYTLVRGWYGETIKTSRIKNLLTQCGDSYCVFTLGGGTLYSGISVQGDQYKPRWTQLFVIPSKDTATLTPFQTMYNAMLAQSKIPYKSNTQSCYVDAALITASRITGRQIGN